MSRLDRIVTALPLVGLVVGATACGGTDLGSEQPNETEEARRASSLMLTPTLDLDSLFEPGVAERIEVDEILINLAEVRMLGTDPRIPAEGVPLLDTELLVLSDGDAKAPAVVFSFPDYLLDDLELAVFLRVGPSEGLGGASVIVRGRYASMTEAAEVRAAQSYVGATDPDVDPMDDSDCATDPDVDPMDCGEPTQTAGAGLAGVPPGVVPFELRDEQVVDLLTTLGHGSSLDVVLGVPAARWITPEVIDDLEQASEDRAAALEAGRAYAHPVVSVDPDHVGAGAGDTPPRQLGSSPDGYNLDRRPGRAADRDLDDRF